VIAAALASKLAFIVLEPGAVTSTAAIARVALIDVAAVALLTLAALASPRGRRASRRPTLGPPRA